MRRSCRLLNKLLCNYSYSPDQHDEVFNGINVEFYGGYMRLFLIASTATISLALSFSAFAQDKSTSSQGLQGSGHSSKMDHGTMHSSPNAAKAPFDLQFIDTMVMHHQSAVDMAQLAEKQSAHDELKQLARKMIDDQKNEIRQMQQWRQQWYEGKGAAMNMKMPGMVESMKGMSMEKLDASNGNAFDAMFINMMTRHHDGAITMARDALKKAQHKEIRELAQNVIDAQKKEIDQMTTWKKEWKLAGK
jgi:uncharacterized protein (DUF305 family)